MTFYYMERRLRGPVYIATDQIEHVLPELTRVGRDVLTAILRKNLDLVVRNAGINRGRDNVQLEKIKMVCGHPARDQDI